MGGEKAGKRLVLGIWGSTQEFIRFSFVGSFYPILKQFAVYCELFMCINTLEGATLFTKYRILCHYTTG